MEDPRIEEFAQKLIEDPRVEAVIAEAVEPQLEAPVAPPGVKIKEGLTEDFIKQVKKALGKELPEPTPEDLKTLAALIKKVFGPDLAAYVCKQDNTRILNRWIKGDVVPEHYEKNALLYAANIAKILIDRMTYEEARNWMMTPSPYLLGDLPFDVIRDDPELVRKAALWRVL